MMLAALSFAVPEYPLQYASAGRSCDVTRKSLRQVYPLWHAGTFALKKSWICCADIVLLFVKTASLMMFPAWNPARVIGRIDEGAEPVVAAVCATTFCDAAADPAEIVTGTSAVTKMAMTASTPTIQRGGA